MAVLVVHLLHTVDVKAGDSQLPGRLCPQHRHVVIEPVPVVKTRQGILKAQPPQLLLQMHPLRDVKGQPLQHLQEKLLLAGGVGGIFGLFAVGYRKMLEQAGHLQPFDLKTAVHLLHGPLQIVPGGKADSAHAGVYL